MVLLVPATLFAGALHPTERQLRRNFPSLSLDSWASFERSDAFVGARMISGLRARFPVSQEPALRVQYPRSFDEPIVVELGSQRIVLRAVGAAPTVALETGGKVLYEQPFADTDAMEIARVGWSEELLVLRSERAPQRFEYEVVETDGIAAIVPDAGALRCLPEQAASAGVQVIVGGHFAQRQPALQIDRPWLIDSSGRRLDSAARWVLEGRGPIPRTIRLEISGQRLAFPIVVDPSFSSTGSLTTGRQNHTATLLPIV
jgi:hypothetical protein